MKKAWLLLALLWAVPALAQSTYGTEGNVVNPTIGDATHASGKAGAPGGQIVCGYFAGDTTYRCLHLDTNGNLKVTEGTTANRENWARFSLISNAALATGVADSCGVQDVHAYRHLKLLIRITPSSPTAKLTRIGLQIRTHDNQGTDSTSTYAEYFYGTGPAIGNSPTSAAGP